MTVKFSMNQSQWLMVRGITPMSSHARSNPAAIAMANMLTASETRDLRGDREAEIGTGAVSRYHMTIHTPSAKNPTKVLAYCRNMNVDIHPTIGTLIAYRSQGKCSHGQVWAWVNESQSKWVAIPRTMEKAIANILRSPPRLNSPNWSLSLCCMPMGSSPAIGFLIAQ